jgi:hypothetical protein
MNPLMSPYYPSWNMNSRPTFLTQTDDDWNPIPVNPMGMAFLFSIDLYCKFPSISME